MWRPRSASRCWRRSARATILPCGWGIVKESCRFAIRCASWHACWRLRDFSANASTGASKTTRCSVRRRCRRLQRENSERQCKNNSFENAMSQRRNGIRMPLLEMTKSWPKRLWPTMAIAEQVQNGKMSVAEGGTVVTEKWSQEVSESQRRRNASLSLAAQQDAAAAQQDAAAAQQSAAAASWAPKDQSLVCILAL